MGVELVNDTSVRVANALSNLQINALAGGLLVIIVLWLFLGLRNSLSAVGIPVAFALAFVLLKYTGASINENTFWPATVWAWSSTTRSSSSKIFIAISRLAATASKRRARHPRGAGPSRNIDANNYGRLYATGTARNYRRIS